MDGWIMDGWLNGEVNEWMDGDGWMNGRMDGWMGG
jgi:hypothetical protein